MVCSEDVCSALCSVPPCWAGNCSQPIPFPKRPLRSSGEYQDLTHINPHGAPENSREQSKTEEIFPLLSYALLFFFNIYRLKKIIVNIPEEFMVGAESELCSV